MGQPVVAQQHGVVESAEGGLFHPVVFRVLFLHRPDSGPPGPDKFRVIRHRVSFKEAKRPVSVQRQLRGGEGGQSQSGQPFFAALEATPQPGKADPRRQQAAGQQPAPPAVGLSAEEVDQHPQRRRQRPGGKAGFEAQRPGEGSRAQGEQQEHQQETLPVREPVGCGKAMPDKVQRPPPEADQQQGGQKAVDQLFPPGTGGEKVEQRRAQSQHAAVDRGQTVLHVRPDEVSGKEFLDEFQRRKLPAAGAPEAGALDLQNFHHRRQQHRTGQRRRRDPRHGKAANGRKRSLRAGAGRLHCKPCGEIQYGEYTQHIPHVKVREDGRGKRQSKAYSPFARQQPVDTGTDQRQQNHRVQPKDVLGVGNRIAHEAVAPAQGQPEGLFAAPAPLKVKTEGRRRQDHLECPDNAAKLAVEFRRDDKVEPGEGAGKVVGEQSEGPASQAQIVGIKEAAAPAYRVIKVGIEGNILAVEVPGHHRVRPEGPEAAGGIDGAQNQRHAPRSQNQTAPAAL